MNSNDLYFVMIVLCLGKKRKRQSLSKQISAHCYTLHMKKGLLHLSYQDVMKVVTFLLINNNSNNNKQ